MMYFIHSDVLHYCKYILVAHGIICTVLLARYVLIRAIRAKKAKKWEYSIKVSKLCKRSSIMIMKITRICSVYFFSLNRIYAAKHLCLILSIAHLTWCWNAKQNNGRDKKEWVQIFTTEINADFMIISIFHIRILWLAYPNARCINEMNCEFETQHEVGVD